MINGKESWADMFPGSKNLFLFLIIYLRVSKYSNEKKAVLYMGPHLLFFLL